MTTTNIAAALAEVLAEWRNRIVALTERVEEGAITAADLSRELEQASIGSDEAYRAAFTLAEAPAPVAPGVLLTRTTLSEAEFEVLRWSREFGSLSAEYGAVGRDRDKGDNRWSAWLESDRGKALYAATEALHLAARRLFDGADHLYSPPVTLPVSASGEAEGGGASAPPVAPDVSASTSTPEMLF